MNTVNLIGRLTKDIDLRETNSGTKYAGFCIAVEDGKDNTYFIDCKAWQKTAENIAKFFKKGDKLAVTGKLATRTWEDDGGSKRKITEVVVNAFDFCNSRDKIETPAEPDMAGAMPFEC